MRDPFSLVPVRVKLLLTFAFLYIVAFGLGGYIVTTAARAALHNPLIFPASLPPRLAP